MSDANKPTDADRLLAADAQCVWHPFTPMRQWPGGAGDPGRLIVAGEGFHVIDAQGRRFVDGFSSLWCNLHGHQVARIDRAIRDQLDRIAHSTLLGHAQTASIDLAERLVRLTPPGLGKVFYSDSGATAVEVALKMAYQYWHNRGQVERRRFIALRESYHGDTIGSVSLGGISTFHEVFHPLLFETTFVDCPNAYRHPAGPEAGHVALRQIEALLTDSPGEFCAVIVEPLCQGAAGMLIHPAGFLAGVRELPRSHDTLLIAAEVAPGFARTGKLFACAHEQVSPDLMCLGKGLTGGYLPIAATMATQDIFDAFCGDLTEGKTFYHGHTYTGNALGCAAAVASIDLIAESGLLESLPAKVEQIRTRLAGLADHPNVGDIRQCGMMVGIELVADKAAKTPFDLAKRVGADVCLRARDRGVIIRPLGDVVVLMPAPAMDQATLADLLAAVTDTIHDFFG